MSVVFEKNLKSDHLRNDDITDPKYISPVYNDFVKVINVRNNAIFTLNLPDGNTYVIPIKKLS